MRVHPSCPACSSRFSSRPCLGSQQKESALFDTIFSSAVTSSELSVLPLLACTLASLVYGGILALVYGHRSRCPTSFLIAVAVLPVSSVRRREHGWDGRGWNPYREQWVIHGHCDARGAQLLREGRRHGDDVPRPGWHAAGAVERCCGILECPRHVQRCRDRERCELLIWISPGIRSMQARRRSGQRSRLHLLLWPESDGSGRSERRFLVSQHHARTADHLFIGAADGTQTAEAKGRCRRRCEDECELKRQEWHHRIGSGLRFQHRVASGSIGCPKSDGCASVHAERWQTL